MLRSIDVCNDQEMRLSQTISSPTNAGLNGTSPKGDDKLIVCKNCGTPLSKTQIGKRGSFCSKACATSFRCKAWDPDFFTSDIKVVSYLIGLLFTDGNLNKEKTRLTLSLTEKTVIEQLFPYFSDTEKRKIYKYQPSGNVKPLYTILNSNIISIEKMQNIGMAPCNSANKPFPDLSELNLHDFLRGVFDGDGCIYCSSHFKEITYYAISITVASKLFAEGLINLLESIGLRPHLVEDSRRHLQEIKTFYIKIYRQEDIKAFAQYIYQDAYIKNNTKFEKFQKGDMI